MGKLVQDGDRPPLNHGLGDFGTEDVVLQEGDGAGVLHGTGVELRDEKLVVLRERIWRAELLLVELESLPGEFEDVIRIQILHQRLAGKDTQLNGAAVRTGQFAAH